MKPAELGLPRPDAEARVFRLFMAAALAEKKEEAQALWREFVVLHAARPRELVEQMERAQGLR